MLRALLRLKLLFFSQEINGGRTGDEMSTLPVIRFGR